jgi:hypothetical protein
MDRRARTRELLAAALADVERELEVPRQALSPDELGRARDTLRGYLAAIDGGALPPRRDREEDLCRMILDSWPYESALGAAILQAERAWRNC